MIRKTVNYISLLKKWTLFLIFLWVVVVFNSSLPGKVDGYMFPVISQFKFNIEPMKDGTVLINGSFIKNRSCAFVDIDWNLYNPNQDLYTRMHVDFLEGEIVRSEGYHHFGPWRIKTSPERITTNSFVSTRHQCFLINLPFFQVKTPWITITNIYP